MDIPDNVPKAWAERLHAGLKKLDGLKGARPGLAADLARYVMHGEAIAVLQEIGQVTNAADYLQLNGASYGRKISDLGPPFYDEFESVPPAVALRWAKLLEAAIAPNSHVKYAYIFPNGVHWPEVLLAHAAGLSITGWSGVKSAVRGISLPQIEKLLQEAGLPPSALMQSAFSSPADSFYGADARLQMVDSMAGYSDALARHADIARPLLLAPAVAQRVHTLQLLDKADIASLRLFVQGICELATASSKQVRSAAERLAAKCAADIVPPLNAIAANGKPDQRTLALRLLHDFARDTGDAELQASCRRTAEGDKAPSVRALLQEWAHAETVPQTDASLSHEVPVIDWTNALTPEVSSALDAFRADTKAFIDSATIESLRNYIGSPDPHPTAKPGKSGKNWNALLKALRHFATQPGVTPVVLLKTLAFFGIIGDGSSLRYGAENILGAMNKATGRPTLLELQLIIEAMGYGPASILESYCHGWGNQLARDWPDHTVWPFFAHNLDLVVQYLKGGAPQRYSFDRPALFQAIGTFPAPPGKVVDTLFDLALGAGKADRPLAQQALAKLPDKERRIMSALEDGKADVRTVAAQWLGRLKYAPAQAALEKAVAKEKNDVAKGAMLDTLQALGQPVEKYLNRDTLAKDAEKALAKGLPRELEWFPWESMPAVSWADSGEPVPGTVLRWMLAQAVKQKSPEPNAVLRKFCSMFDPRSREQFGQFLLEAWLSEDAHPISADEAMQRASQLAQQMHNYMHRSPQYYQNDPKFGYSVEQLTAAFLPGFMRQPAGSAIGSKGLLAVAAACAAERAASQVARYLKEYYGTRAAQGKALIAMLAWIDHPTATQLMLSVGNRFRTKSFQEEAMRQAEALAERKGWTVAELADRTIPAAGFDEMGTLELSYGERSFTAKLQPDFKVVLFNAEGKKLSALPEPRQSEDAELAKDAKKAYSGAKKEIKNIVAMQTDRLYEALCTERDWPYGDWNQYLNQHPVVRRLVHRLVWCQFEDGRVLQIFRPLEDGTLTDVNDSEVKLPPTARVRLAHDSIMSMEEVAQWQQHLNDYEIAPLFQQLGKGTYTLSSDRASDDEIRDFVGHVLEAFALRGRALKLGYTRGAAQDGGWFYTYDKRFPTLGLRAEFDFTGNGLPEENRIVALGKLAFYRIAGGEYQENGLQLSNVPKVLVSECYNDMRLLAAEGTGYDPDWEKKTEL